MGLRFKFNLILFFAFAIGFVSAGFFAFNILQQNARDEVLHNAGIMMASAMAIRAYTVNEIKPLLARQQKKQFLPQTVPAYAATQNIKRLRVNYPDYTYKEATINPTNPMNRAASWEMDIVEWFRSHPEEKEFIGERDTPTGPALYLSRPIRVKNEGCLNCHGMINDAPETMKALYGSANGFGWKMDQVVGAQVVSVPSTIPYERAERAFITFMGSLLGVFILIALLLNLTLHGMIIRRIRVMSRLANEVSMGGTELPEFEPKGNDEITSLAQSFNRMRRSLGSAINMLDDTIYNKPPK